MKPRLALALAAALLAGLALAGCANENTNEATDSGVDPGDCPTGTGDDCPSAQDAANETGASGAYTG